MAPLTVPPAVTLMPSTIRLASVSLPVVMLILPTAVSVGSPLAPAAAASPEPSDSEPRAGSPASLTLWSPVTPTVGVESPSSVIVTVAIDVSPSPSVILYWKVTVPCSPAVGV